VVIFSIGLIALVGISAQALNQVTQSRARNDASFLASELIGEMWVSPSTPAAFNATTWLARVRDPANLPGGDAVLQFDAADPTKVTITISWSDRKEAGVRHQYITTAVVARNT
jgi:type IV pilus assembly protein PilV